MNDVLGALEALESYILSAKNLPLSNKVIVNEKIAMDMLDKIRLLVKNASMPTHQVELDPKEVLVNQVQQMDQEAQRLLDEANKQADAIRFDAKGYADDIFVRLQVMVAKLRKNLLRLDQNIDQGRHMLTELQESAVDQKEIEKYDTTNEHQSQEEPTATSIST